MKEIKKYHSNGQIKCHYWLNVKGQLEGEAKSWNENGQLALHCFHKNGLLDSEYKGWHFNGQLWEHCFYKNGKFNGEYKRWNIDGQLELHYLYHDSRLINVHEHVADVNNITEQEYFLLQMTFGHFPIIKFDGTEHERN